MFADRLRKSLLQAAIQGQLTEQLPTDGDARDLLKKIRAEKAKLLAEKKIKAEKPLPTVTDNEISFDIPESWCWVRLGDIGDIVIARTGGTVGKTFVVENLSDETIFASYLIRVIFNENISSKYIKIFAGSPLYWRQIIDKSQGTGQPNVNGKSLSNLILPLPPFAEQKRIVEKLNELLPEVDELAKDERELVELEETFPRRMRNSLLQAAIQGKLTEQLQSDGDARDLLRKIRAKKAKLFAEKKIKAEKSLPPIKDDEIPFDLPDNWCWCRLGDVCEMYTGNSIAEFEKKSKYLGLADGFSYIGTKDISFDSRIDYDNGVCIPFENNFRQAKKNSVLMCIEGGSAGRKIAITDRDVCFGNKLCNFNADKISNEYIYYYLQSPTFLKFFRDNVTGMIGGVSLKRLNSILLLLPPLAEQKRILKKLNELLPLCTI